MVNLYYYLLKIATKKAPATKKIADASPKARFRQLSRRLSRLFSLLYLRQFSFSESLLKFLYVKFFRGDCQSRAFGLKSQAPHRSRVDGAGA